MSKIKTNEQLLRALLKDLSNIEAALLRERLLTISDATRKDIEKNSKAYDSGFVHHTLYLAMCDKIDKALDINQ